VLFFIAFLSKKMQRKIKKKFFEKPLHMFEKDFFLLVKKENLNFPQAKKVFIRKIFFLFF
jgi:hypothetical protein